MWGGSRKGRIPTRLFGGVGAVDLCVRGDRTGRSRVAYRTGCEHQRRAAQHGGEKRRVNRTHVEYDDGNALWR